MRKKRSKKYIRQLITLCLSISVMLVACLLIISIFVKNGNPQIASAAAADPAASETEAPASDTTPKELSSYVTNTAVVNRYFVYGTSFQLSGTLNIDPAITISRLSLLLCPVAEPTYSGAVAEVNLTFTTEGDTVSFSNTDVINDGLCMETIDPGEYILLIAVNDSDEQIIPYTLQNSSDEDALTYYTLTRNSSNQCITLSNQSIDELPYLGLSCISSTLPEDVYDIVIDPGHGGKDGGAVSKTGNYTESELMLSYAKAAKALLEQKGYKVLLTRDGTESASAPMAYNMYDHDGRINVACASKAKYAFSFHLNSNTAKVFGGLQIYTSYKCDDTFAQELASQITKASSLTYSNMETYRRANGVYSRAYLEKDITEAASSAASHGFSPYENITTSTDYYFIIRELGGIATDAHTDGRDTRYGTNEYCNANWGLETYLCEWGYISESNDLNVILNEKDQLLDGFVSAVSSHIDQLYRQ